MSTTTTSLTTTLTDLLTPLPPRLATTYLAYITLSANYLLSDMSQHRCMLSRPDFPTIEYTCRQITNLTNAHANANGHEGPEGRAEFIQDVSRAAQSLMGEMVREVSRYEGNMALLLEVVRKRMESGLWETGSWLSTYYSLTPCGLTSALALKARFGHHESAEWHPKYLHEIETYWRKYGGTAEARDYEDVWMWVAGRRLMQE